MTPQSPAQLGICSWSTHAQTPGELIDRLEAIGLQKVQLALGPLRDPDSPMGGVVAELTQKRYTIVSGMFGTRGEDYSSLESIRRTGGLVADEHWDENFQIAHDCAKIAEDFGLTKVSFHAGFIPPDPDDPGYAKLLDRIAEVSGQFIGRGIMLLFETGQETADTLNRCLSDLHERGVTNVGVNFDPANMILYNMGDPIESLRKLMPHVRQVHIKDAVATDTPGTWGKEVAIGEGQVDWDAFLRVLAEYDFTDDLIIEREAGADRVGDVRQAVKMLTEKMSA